MFFVYLYLLYDYVCKYDYLQKLTYNERLIFNKYILIDQLNHIKNNLKNLIIDNKYKCIYDNFMLSTSSNIFSSIIIDTDINLEIYHEWFKILDDIIPKPVDLYYNNGITKHFFTLKWDIKLNKYDYNLIIYIISSYNFETQFITLNKYPNKIISIDSLDENYFINNFSDLFT